MKNFEKLSDKLARIANIVGSNIFLTSIKDAFMFALPQTIIGSMLVVIANFPGIGDGIKGPLNDILGPTITICLQLMSVFVSFGIGYHYSYHKTNRPIESLYVGIATLASFLILVPIFSVDNGQFIPISYLGASGLFLAIVNSFFSAVIFLFLERKNIVIKMPEGVPPNVAKSFSSLIPVTLVILLTTTIRYGFTFTNTGNVIDLIYNVIQAPLSGIGTSYLGTVFGGAMINFLWFFGIHGSLTINPIFEAFWQANSLENLEAFNAGMEVLPHIVTKSFFDTFFISVGGSGLLAFVIATFITSKSKQQREIAKLGVAPLTFNVFEPIIFGTPIVLNPIYFIPWLLTPIVLISMAYFSMWAGLVPYTTGAIVPWTVPVVLSGFLATNSIMGSILQIVQMIAMFFLWLPFVLVAGRVDQKQSEELLNEKENNEN